MKPDVQLAAILTGVRGGGSDLSDNKKTGQMAQLTIVIDDEHSPMEHIRRQTDDALCGECFHRGDPSTDRPRTCYVRVYRSIETQYKKLRGLPVRRGARAIPYGEGRPAPGQPIRLGAYGDPGFLPLDVLRRLTLVARTWTGYTHQWKSLPLGYARYLMASCETYEECILADLKGWRTFFCRKVDDESALAARNWINCPASEEAGKLTTCEKCRLCMGSSAWSKSHIWIRAHGASRLKV